MNDDLDLLDDLDTDTDTGSGLDSDSGSDAPPAVQPDGDGDKEAKRVSDLMSKWQKEQAANKKLQARIAALEGRTDQGSDVPPQVKQWMDAAKEAARERFYESDPRLAEYGIPMSAIAGDSPEDMRASAKTYRELIDSVESKARDRVLIEHGIAPASVGSARGPKKDFASMTDDEFEREVARHSAGYL